ncbi:hypothetical protein A9Q81_19300 [Gammaproteobacteria bacterium 42_54_T18]|nr:hypothetical protein A9Q81_19300 [Gammaproteobacteria bacterium 42_54_T18]
MRLNLNLPAHIIHNVVISIIFLFLISFFLGGLYQYWYKVLDPRLHLAAKTQAEILSQSQAGALLKALEIQDEMQREKAVHLVLEEVLLITDPSIDEPFIKGVALEVDYDVVGSEKGSLDLRKGVVNCQGCIETEIGVVDDELNMLAVAHFQGTGAYYRWLGADLRSEMITQALIISVLFIAVWLIILVLVYRLNKVNKNIEIADRAKTRFMANVSHELRTPLNAILGYTQLFKKDVKIMEVQGRGVDTIHRSAAHLLTLINDILDFSKVDSDAIKLTPADVPLLEFLNALVEMTAVRAEMKDIKLIYDFSDELPAVVFVDEKRLRQVLLNLLNNAVKFTEGGAVTFSIDVVSMKDQGGGTLCELHFSISDTGIGIPKSMLEDVFVPYQQVGNSMTSAEGSGLGLTISKNLVELMGANLTVKSQLGEGSEFSFDLKLQVTDEKMYPMEPANLNVIGYKGGRKNILIVDDIDFNRDVLSLMLQRLGFVVNELSSGEGLLQKVKEQKVDLIFLDIYMPGKDGFAVLDELRNAGYEKLPVVALTAVAKTDVRERVGQAGFQGVLEKPVEEGVMMGLLAEYLCLNWIVAPAGRANVDSDKPMVMPNNAALSELKDLAAKHNVLAIRRLVAGFSEVDEYKSFVNRIEPLAKNYQFLKIIQFVEGVENAE